MPHTPPIPWFHEVARDQRFLVAVSGGADSLALLHLLVEAGFQNLIVCHLHHGLRGQAADEDAAFVQTLAGSLGLKFETQRVDIAATTGKSLETAGREARHAFFAGCAKRHDCPRVLLAHHADDRAETVLWNLLRGSYGAKGMRSRQKMAVGEETLELIRPLLDIRRADLRRYLEERKLSWREDSTNAEPIAIRNRLRNEVFPLLEAILGRNVVPPLERAAEAAADQEEILAWALDRANVFDPQGRLHVPTLRELPPALQRAAVFRFLANHGIGNLDRDLLLRSVALIEPDAGSACVNLPGGWSLRRREGRMTIE